MKKLIRQSIFYNASVLIFQSFITFYLIKYLHGIQGALIGNAVLYLAMALGYLMLSWLNYKKKLDVKWWFAVSMIISLFATALVQWNTYSLLLLGSFLLGVGKGIYSCCLHLYEFAFIHSGERVRYAGAQNAWHSAVEIIIPFVLGYTFTLISLPQIFYVVIFLLSSLTCAITTLTIEQLPELTLRPSYKIYYKKIIKHTSWIDLCYLGLVGFTVIISFIGSVMDVQYLESEASMGIISSILKGIAFVILLLVFHYFHGTKGYRQLKRVGIVMGVLVLAVPWWTSTVIAILFAIVKSLLLPLFLTYEKSVDMHIMEDMKGSLHSMLPIIVVQIVLQSIVRFAMFATVALYLWIFDGQEVSVLIILMMGLTSITFFILAALLWQLEKREKQ